MEYSCEVYMNYAYEGEVKIPLSVRFQNAITKLITAIKKFILKIRSIKKEHVVPKKVLDAYRSLSRMCYNCMNRCKNSLLSGESARVIFTEPFESQEYKILFSDEIKEKAKPGEYVKIASSEVLNFMNVSLTIISNAKQGLRTIDKEAHPNRTQSFTQLINYAKFMLKISNRVLSYKNMYVEKRHLPTTKVEESEGVNESYLSCVSEIDIAMEGIFGKLFKKKDNKPLQQTHPSSSKPSPEAEKYKEFVSKKTTEYLKKYVKEHKFDQKYKMSLFSYPTIDIEFDEDYGVQITRAQNGTLYTYEELDRKDYAYIKNKYGEISEDELYEKHPDLFNNKWYYELQNVGITFAKKFSNEKFDVKADYGDGDEGLVFIDVYDKESVTESYNQIAEEGILRNLFKKKQ